MKLLAKIAVAALAAGLAAGLAQAKEWKTIRIGTEGAYPPFNYKDSAGNLKGFDVDIAQALCDKLKVKCVFVAQDWDGIIPGLLAKKYDAIVASMSITAERKKKVDFTDKYYSSPATFVAPKNSPVSDISPEAMKGKTIGAQASTIHSNYLEDNYKGSRLKFYKTQDEVNADLAAGRLDAQLADKLVLFEWLKTKDGQCCKFVGPAIKDPRWFGEGAGIAVRKEDTDLKAMLNKALKEILADGTYEKINKKYFPFSIY